MIFYYFCADMNSPGTDKWLNDHKNLDFADMWLKAGDNTARRNAAIQFHARKKAAKKIPELLLNKDFSFPSLLSAEQCTSELLAKYHASLIEKAAKVVDFTAGLGIDSIYLSKIADSVTSIDILPESCECLKSNTLALNIGNITVINDDSMRWLRQYEGVKFDVGFIDPFRRDATGGKVITLTDSQPNVVEHLDVILGKCSILIIKASPMLDISLAVKSLKGHAYRVIALGTKKECKELLFLCNNENHDHVEIDAVTLAAPGVTIGALSSLDCAAEQNELQETEVTEGMFLYEPYPAVFKSKLFSQLSQAYNVNQLSPGTHLFVADCPALPDIPAKAYKIINIIPFCSSNLKKVRKQWPKVNIATRNFPLTAPQLEKKLGVTPGGDYKIFGATISDRRRVLIVTSQTCEP